MNTEIRVSDMQVAAYLMARDYPLLRVEGDCRRKVFVYDASEEVVMQYYRGTDNTSARKLLGAYKDLKALLMGSMRAQG